MTGETTTLILEKIMTKTTKIALSFLLLFTSLEGSGKAQEYPTVIQQQCAVNCMLTFMTHFASCATQPASCLQPFVTDLQNCIVPTPNFSPCQQCQPVSGQPLTNYIVQQDAVNCFTTFNSGFTSCTTFACAAPYVTNLSKCLTQISGSAACTPPESKL